MADLSKITLPNNNAYNLKDSGAVRDCTLSIYNGNAGNPGVVKFCTVDYTSCGSENGVLIKVSMRSGHGNGSSYNCWQDAVLSVTYQGAVSVNIYRYYAGSVAYDSTTHYYGDILYTIDTTNKVVKFYTLMGQYASIYQSPYLRLNASSGGSITQHTGAAIRDISGTYTYGNVYWLDGSTKQDTLVSGTNIKTINNNSILGSGNLSVSTTVDNKAATLSYGTTTTIATVGGTNITVTMPAAPTAVWG